MPGTTTDTAGRSRRGILLKAAALGAAALAAQAAGERGASADGEVVKVGEAHLNALSYTEIGGDYNGQVLGAFNNSAGNKSVAFVARIASGFPPVAPAAILGVSGHPQGDGVVGKTVSDTKSGVFGSASGKGNGVTGISQGGIGVYGRGDDNGTGVSAVSNGAGNAIQATTVGGGFALLAEAYGAATIRAVNPGGAGVAVSAESLGATGTVEALNRGAGPALKGIAQGSGAGVTGEAQGGGAGVVGVATAGAAVYGRNDGASDGVLGEATEAESAAVRGVQRGGGFGVYGESTSGGVGVLATAPAPAGGAAGAPRPGIALDVQGLNRFTQVGRGAFEAGKRQHIIQGIAATENSGILVTLNGAPGAGVFLEHARVNPGARRAVLTLSGEPRRRVPFTYFIVEAAVP